MENKGYVHIYTGNGKGKTTAAIGVAVRMLFCGKSVYMGQFVKSIRYNEARLDEVFPRFTIEQFGSGCWIYSEPTPLDKELAIKGYQKVLELARKGEFDLLILDELNIALHYNLLEVDDIIRLIREKHPTTELIITGRYAPRTLIDEADLATEMKETKHYYTMGVPAREGIER